MRSGPCLRGVRAHRRAARLRRPGAASPLSGPGAGVDVATLPGRAAALSSRPLQRNAASVAARRRSRAQLRAWEPPLAEAGAVLRARAWRGWPGPRALCFVRHRAGRRGRVRPALPLAGSTSPPTPGGGVREGLRRRCPGTGPSTPSAAPPGWARTATISTSARGARGAALRVGRTAAPAPPSRCACWKGGRCGKPPGASRWCCSTIPWRSSTGAAAALVLEQLVARGTGQTVLAVPRPDDVPPAFAGLARFRVRAGEVTPWPGA